MTSFNLSGRQVVIQKHPSEFLSFAMVIFVEPTDRSPLFYTAYGPGGKFATRSVHYHQFRRIGDRGFDAQV